MPPNLSTSLTMKLTTSLTKMKRQGVNGHPGLILLPILKVLAMPPLRHIIAIIAFLNNKSTKSTIPMNSLAMPTFFKVMKRNAQLTYHRLWQNPIVRRLTFDCNAQPNLWSLALVQYYQVCIKLIEKLFDLHILSPRKLAIASRCKHAKRYQGHQGQSSFQRLHLACEILIFFLIFTFFTPSLGFCAKYNTFL